MQIWYIPNSSKLEVAFDRITTFKSTLHVNQSDLLVELSYNLLPHGEAVLEGCVLVGLWQRQWRVHGLRGVGGVK